MNIELWDLRLRHVRRYVGVKTNQKKRTNRLCYDHPTQHTYHFTEGLLIFLVLFQFFQDFFKLIGALSIPVQIDVEGYGQYENQKEQGSLIDSIRLRFLRLF